MAHEKSIRKHSHSHVKNRSMNGQANVVPGIRKRIFLCEKWKWYTAALQYKYKRKANEKAKILFIPAVWQLGTRRVCLFISLYSFYFYFLSIAYQGGGGILSILFGKRASCVHPNVPFTYHLGTCLLAHTTQCSKSLHLVAIQDAIRCSRKL